MSPNFVNKTISNFTLGILGSDIFYFFYRYFFSSPDIFKLSIINIDSFLYRTATLIHSFQFAKLSISDYHSTSTSSSIQFISLAKEYFRIYKISINTSDTDHMSSIKLVFYYFRRCFHGLSIACYR